MIKSTLYSPHFHNSIPIIFFIYMRNDHNVTFNLKYVHPIYDFFIISKVMEDKKSYYK